MSNNRYGGVDSYAAFFIGYKVKQLIRSPFFTYDDYEDLQQELMLAYLLAWPKFDKNQGDRRSFIKTSINNKAHKIIRDAETQKRWTGTKNVSLSMPFQSDEENNDALIDKISSDQNIWNNPSSLEQYREIEINIDMKKISQDMPKELQDLYSLMQEHTISEIADILKIPRTTLSSKAKKLRKYLEKSGAKELMKK